MARIYKLSDITEQLVMANAKVAAPDDSSGAATKPSDTASNDLRQIRLPLDLTNWASRGCPAGGGYLISFVNRRRLRDALTTAYLPCNISHAFDGLPILTNPLAEAIGNVASYAFANSSLRTFDGLSLPYVSDAEGMFDGCQRLTTITNLSIPNLTNARRMFRNCSSLMSICELDFSNATDVRELLSGCGGLRGTFPYVLDFSGVTNLDNLAGALEGVGLREVTIRLSDAMAAEFSTTNVMVYSRLHRLNIVNASGETTSFDLVPRRSFSDWWTNGAVLDGTSFLNATTAAELIDITEYQVEACDGMFAGAQALTSVPKTMVFMNDITTTANMFDGCSSLVEAPTLNLPATVTTVTEMFKNCSSLNSTPRLNLSADVVTDASAMFKNCSALTSADLGFIGAANADEMFMNCSSLKTLTNVDLTKVTSAVRMFSGAGLETTPTFKLNGEVTSADEMFMNCTELTTVANVDFNGVNAKRVFKGCTGLREIRDSDLGNMGNNYNEKTAFQGCEAGIERIINVRGNLSYLNWSAFENLVELDISSYENESFYISGVPNLESATLHNNVSIESCPSLKTLTFYANRMVPSVYGNEALTQVTILGFNGSQSPDDFVMPEGRDYPYLDDDQFLMVGEFSDCTSLVRVDGDLSRCSRFPIYNYTFYRCTSLTTPPTLGCAASFSRTFYDCTSLPEVFPQVIDMRLITKIWRQADAEMMQSRYERMFEGSSVKRATVMIGADGYIPPSLTASWLGLEQMTIIDPSNNVLKVSDLSDVPTVCEKYAYNSSFKVPGGVTRMRLILVSGANYSYTTSSSSSSMGVITMTVNPSRVKDASGNVLVESLGSDAPGAIVQNAVANGEQTMYYGYALEADAEFNPSTISENTTYYGSGILLTFTSSGTTYRGYATPGQTKVDTVINVTPGETLTLEVGTSSRYNDGNKSCRGYIIAMVDDEYMAG